MSSLNNDFWRTLEERVDDPTFRQWLENEFLRGFRISSGSGIRLRDAPF